MITLASKRYTLLPYNGTLNSAFPTGSGEGGAYPELPRYSVDVTYTEPTGNTWTATNTSTGSVAGTGTGNRTDCSLTYALANCERGDKIVLTAGSTYATNYILPTKTGTGWVYIVSSALASLPYGTRVTPAVVANMAIIQGDATSGAVIRLASGASHWRMAGIKICCPTDQAYTGWRVRMTDDPAQATLPTHFILDRCWIAGDATYYGGTGVLLGGGNAAVIESYLDNHGQLSSERQAVLIYQDGPYLIRNNYLSAGGEVVLTGGGGLSTEERMVSDLTITGNYFYVPTAWAVDTGTKMSIKNLLEFKTGRRILVEGNLLENMWAGQGQNGTAVLLTPRNQYGGDPWNYIRDVTIRNNKILNVCRGFTVAGGDNDAGGTLQLAHTDRVLIENNLVILNGATATAVQGVLTYTSSNISAIACDAGYPENTDGLPADNYIFRHNTFVWTADPSAGSGRIGYWDTTDAAWKMSLFTASDNIFHFGQYGFGNSFLGGDGTAALDKFATTWEFSNNGFFPISGVSATYPATTVYQATAAGVGFTNYAGGDYTLTVGSPWHNAASDGTDIGCDIAAMEAELND